MLAYLSPWGDILQGVGALFTAAALLSGVWLYYKRKAHLDRPSDSTNARIITTHVDGFSIFEVKVEIANRGNSPFRIKEFRASVSKLNLANLSIDNPALSSKIPLYGGYNDVLAYPFRIPSESQADLSFLVKIPSGSGAIEVEWYSIIDRQDLNISDSKKTVKLPPVPVKIDADRTKGESRIGSEIILVVE